MISLSDLYDLFLEHPFISTDSRKVRPGCLFFSLRGEKFDGNLFAQSALEQGAAFSVIDDEQVKQNDKFILVNDVLKTLQELAQLHRNHFSIPLLAITGTNGKTTTKELTQAVLSKKYRTIATEGNLNNHIGVPLTLLRIQGDTEIVVMEMGANHPGEIEFLCRLARPTHGIITNVGKAHLEGFGGFEGVIKAKTELYRYLSAINGTIFFNIDNPVLSGYSANIDRISYGTGMEAGFRGELIRSDPFVTLKADLHARPFTVESRLYGAYNFENLLAAACIGHHFNVDPEDIISAITSYEPVNNRSQVLTTSRNLLIMDAYNANPSSMELAVRDFASSSFSNKVLILGDMLELGEESDREHLNILGIVAELGFKQVYLVGPVFTSLNKRREWTCFQDSELARTWFAHHSLSRSAVLIKGSRGIMLEKVAEVL